jgi:1-acyl-sn-glycerol-3-phosphate acyltransferase
VADLAYRLSNRAFRQVLTWFADWQVEGWENVPPFGPLIVVANHLSNLDPPLLAVSIPRRLHFVAKRTLFRWGVGAFLRAYGAYPVDRDGGDAPALLWGLDLLRRDGALVVFPEGRRNPRGGMRRGQPGLALLALRSRAPLLPVGVTGTEHLGPLWRLAFPTGRIRVRIGEPFTLPLLEGKVSREQLQALTDMSMARVAALLPPSYQGFYAHPAPGVRGAAPLS